MNTDLQIYNNEQQQVIVHHMSMLDRYVAGLHIKYNGLPAQIALAQTRTDLTPSKRLAMLGTYETGHIVNMSEYINRIVRILGCVIIEHGPYIGQDMQEHKGYNYLLIKTGRVVKREIIRGRQVEDIMVPVIIKVSSVGLDPFFLGQIVMDQAMDFKKPIQVMFSGSQSSGYHCSIVEDEEVGVTIEEMASKPFGPYGAIRNVELDDQEED